MREKEKLKRRFTRIYMTKSQKMNNFQPYFFKFKNCKQSYLVMLVLTVLILLSEACFAIDLDDGIPIDSDRPSKKIKKEIDLIEDTKYKK